jgi:hypothetical protein
VRKVNADDKRQAAELIELDGDDLRREPLERRKALLAQLVREPLAGVSNRATWCSSTPARSAARASSPSAWGVSLSLGPLQGVAQVQEPERAGGAAGGGGGLGKRTVGVIGETTQSISRLLKPPSAYLELYPKLWRALGYGPLAAIGIIAQGRSHGGRRHLALLDKQRHRHRKGLKWRTIQLKCEKSIVY